MFLLSVTLLSAIFGLCTSAAVPDGTKLAKELSGNFRADTAGIISSFGYPALTYHVTTEDGYILGLHRIPFGPLDLELNLSISKPVVFLMHGLTGSSEHYVAFGPEISVAYHLVDAGFDVWIGNARGNIHSRNHTTLNPDDEQEKFDFFDYSWEEVGMYDVPAMIDYILELTGRTQLHYIGHSQGGTSFLVLNSMRPEYNEKFASAHLLAGVGFMEYFPDPELTELAQNVDIIYLLARQQGLVELIPEVAATYAAIRRGDNCAADISLRKMCELIGVTRLMERGNVDLSGFGGSGGASVKQYAHYGQNIRDKIFRRWHHGTNTNIQMYGSENPPPYNLSMITVKTVMHYSLNDNLLDERDVLAMESLMPNTVARKVARDSFEHSDYLYAVDAKELVLDFVIESLIEEERLLEILETTETVIVQQQEVTVTTDTTLFESNWSSKLNCNHLIIILLQLAIMTRLISFS